MLASGVTQASGRPRNHRGRDQAYRSEDGKVWNSRRRL